MKHTLNPHLNYGESQVYALLPENLKYLFAWLSPALEFPFQELVPKTLDPHASF